MSGPVRQWARDLRDRVRHRAIDKADEHKGKELPYLPPSSSRAPVSWTTAPDDDDGTAHSAFFTRLPPEIRKQILVVAFGDRTLHMHLRFGAPLVPRAQQQQPPAMAGTAPKPGVPHNGGTPDVRTGAPAVWQWWNCVCHRNPPPGYDRRIWVAPWKDTCVVGVADCCRLYPGEAPDKCRIGCMGWLTTCRRAYAEGMPVLYGTNIIHIEGDLENNGGYRLIETLLSQSSPSPPVPGRSRSALLGHSHRLLIPPLSLELLTRLELVWQCMLFMPPTHTTEEAKRRATWARSLEQLTQTFPNLVTLYISFLGGLYDRTVRPEAYVTEIEQEMLLPLYQMTSRLSRLRKCVAEVPQVVFMPLLNWAQRKGSKVKQPRYWDSRQFLWAPVASNSSEERPGHIGVWIKH